MQKARALFTLWKMYGNMPLAGNRKEDSMTQAERLTFLIEYLISENKELKSFHGRRAFHGKTENRRTYGKSQNNKSI